MSVVLTLLLSMIASKLIIADESTEKSALKNGYPFKKYWTRTNDGYWLRLHRIPHGKHETEGTTNKTKKEVFFLQHGLSATSNNFVHLNGCLAFTLADAGYDVWMGNVRGNIYSRVHDLYANNSAEFWDFTFDDMAYYDLPTMIDTVLEHTKQESLWYVGHSQGTMIMFAKLSDDPEFGDKIKGFFALAPVAKLDTVQKQIRTACRVFYGLKWMWDKSNIRRLPLPYRLLKKLLKSLKELGITEEGLNAEIQRLNVTYIDWSKIPEVLIELFTEGDASIKNLYHYCQAMETGKFQKYDYGGMFGNLINYWQKTPPQYVVSNIATNTWLFSGAQDHLSTPEDVAWLRSQMNGYVVKSYVFPSFNHLHFLVGEIAKKKVYDVILSIVKNQTIGDSPT